MVNIEEICIVMWLYIFYSVIRSVGYFFFENGLFQQFTLQLCETTSCINCYITIRSERSPTEYQLTLLLEQRQALVKFLETSISEVNKIFMPSANEPAVYLECPFDHEPNCPPHLPLDIKEKALMICQCNKSKKVETVPDVCYIQLFKPVSYQKSQLITRVVIYVFLYYMHTVYTEAFLIQHLDNLEYLYCVVYFLCKNYLDNSTASIIQHKLLVSMSIRLKKFHCDVTGSLKTILNHTLATTKIHYSISRRHAVTST